MTILYALGLEVHINAENCTAGSCWFICGRCARLPAVAYLKS
jgi:hypothetical protein